MTCRIESFIYLCNHKLRFGLESINPQVTLSGNAHVTGNVYGGGDAAQVSGSTNVKVQD